MPSSDLCLPILGNEDNRLKDIADKKAIKNLVLVILVGLAIFSLYYFTMDKEDAFVSSFMRSEKKRTETIDLRIEKDGEEISSSEELTILPEGYEDEDSADSVSEDNYLEILRRKLLKELGRNSEGESLVLPLEYDGAKIYWSLPKEEAPYGLLVITFLLCFVIYYSRYDGIKKEKKKRKYELSKELPNMTMQYSLMLNAGLISESAFEELIYQNEENTNYLYLAFKALFDKANACNTSFVYEMYGFASSFGDKDFLRFATLCLEHSNRGSELSSKLDEERKTLFNSSLNSARAKAKEAETKLCFPLMLLLLALVIICIAPAMLTT